MTKFWNLVNRDTEAELRITGDIVDDEHVWIYEWFGDPYANPNALRTELDACGGKPVTVWIDSCGGSVFAAVGIYNALKAYPGRVTVVIDSKAMSAATIVAMAGDLIEITPGAIFMIHNPLTGVEGYASDLRKAADVLDTVKAAIINIYVQRTELSRDKISALMDDETYMSAARALELGFADKIRGAETSASVFGSFGRLTIINRASVDLGSLAEIIAARNPDPEPVADPTGPPPVEDKQKKQDQQNMLAYIEMEEYLNEH